MSEETKNNEFIGLFTYQSITLTKKYDLTTSALYGFIFNRCKLKNKSCYETFETIGNELNVSSKTIQRKIKNLLECGLVEDITGHKPTKPHDARVFIVHPERLEELDRLELMKKEASQPVVVAESRPDKKSSQGGQIVQSDRTNCPARVDKLSDNKERENKEKIKNKTFFSSLSDNPDCKHIAEVVEDRTGVQVSAKWNDFIQFANERCKANPEETIENFFDYLDSTKYDYTFSGYNKFTELWPSAFQQEPEKDFLACCTHTTKAEVKTYVNFGKYTPTGANR